MSPALEPHNTLIWGRAMVSLLLVLGLVLLCAWGARKIQRRFAFGTSAEVDPARKLAVESSLFLDPKTRLVVVRRGGVGHLLSITPGQVQRIETFEIDEPASTAVIPAQAGIHDLS